MSWLLNESISNIIICSWIWGLHLIIYNLTFLFVYLSKIYVYRLEIGLYKFVNKFIWKEEVNQVTCEQV